MSPSIEPGWYTDPSSSTALQRYWDGRQWTNQTRLPDAPGPPRPEKPRRSRWAMIKWGAVATFVLVASVIGYALWNDQQLCSADASGKFTFAAKGEQCISKAKQDDLAAKAEADRSALPTEDAQDAPRGAFDGLWTSLYTGGTYRITQSGSRATIEEYTPGLGLTANGTGTVDGNVASFAFVAANGATGQAVYSLIGPNSLTGTVSNAATGMQQADSLQRSG